MAASRVYLETAAKQKTTWIRVGHRPAGKKTSETAVSRFNNANVEHKIINLL